MKENNVEMEDAALAAVKERLDKIIRPMSKEEKKAFLLLLLELTK